MRVYLDDERATPEGWYRVYDAKSAIALIDSTLHIEVISLDHDLGEGNGTGYDVVCHIEKKVHTDINYLPPILTIHSANPVGRQNMQRAIESIKGAVEANLMRLGYA